MEFNQICYQYSNLFDSFRSSTPILEAKAGRPKSKAKLYVPSEKAFEIGYKHDSVEGRVIQFLDEKPATMEELTAFLQQNFEEYNTVSKCKEKIRQMLLDDVLDFADLSHQSEDETDVPALDPHEDEESPDLHKYIGGAYTDYIASRGDQMADY